MINRSTEYAIAAMSLLAESYCEGKALLTATQIAEARNLQRPFVAKLLTQLSVAGLVKGMPGRNGGYILARKPSTITLLDIANCFERAESRIACPFGSEYCGTGPHCPLHEQVLSLRDRFDQFLAKNDLSVFCSATKKNSKKNLAEFPQHQRKVRRSGNA